MKNVSIVMPLYNCEKTVSRSLESLKCQTYTDFQIVAVDNNCTDGTMSIVRSFQNSLDINIVECTTRGIEAALNTGLRFCKSHLIARQDGDDYWYHDKLEKQVAFLSSNPGVDILGTQIRLLDEAGKVQEEGTMGRKIRYPLSDRDIKSMLLYGQNPICHPSVIFRSTVVDFLGGYEKLFPLAEDLHLWMKAIPHFTFANLGEVLIDYTQKYSPDYDARIPLLIADTYFELYKKAGIVQGERQKLVYEWQQNPLAHGNAKRGLNL